MIPRATFLGRLVLLSLFAGALVSTAQPARPSRELITCGRERVHILDLDTRASDGTPRIVWTWQAAGRQDLPRDYYPFFRSTDECKPIDGGRRILITSSTGGIALVDREKDAVLFYARAANPHSADVLPHGRIAVAASRDRRENKGDSLILFDLAQPGRDLWRTDLPAGHGVVWDEQRQLLWALADADLRTYRLTDWQTSTPTLTRVAVMPLPEDGGHDLFPVPGTPFLALSTATRCWLFDRDRKTLTPHPALANASDVKCLSVHPRTGQLAFVQADRPNWWSERIQFLNPKETLRLPGEEFYKVRWLAPAD